MESIVKVIVNDLNIFLNEADRHSIAIEFPGWAKMRVIVHVWPIKTIDQNIIDPVMWTGLQKEFVIYLKLIA
jgi:hypothetical protein